MQRQITRGEDIGAPEAEHCINFRRPDPDSGHLGQRGDHRIVGRAAQGMIINLGLGQGAGIARLLTAKTLGAQALL